MATRRGRTREESVRVILRCEVKETLADERRKARKNRRRIRRNAVRIFWVENDADACGSFAAVEWHDSDKLQVRGRGRDSVVLRKVRGVTG